MNSVEVNTLPVGWKMLKLSDVCDLLNGYAFKAKEYVEKSNTVIIRMGNIRPNGTFDIEHKIKYLPNKYSEELTRYRLYDGDLVIAMTDLASEMRILGNPTLIKGSDGRNLMLNQRVGKLHKFNFNLITKEYLRYILTSKQIKDYYKSLGGGGLQINIGKQQILSVTIPIPPLSEQKRIVAKIDALFAEIDKAITLTEESLKQAKNLLPSVLKEVFEKGKADGWEVKKLTEVCEKIFAGGDKPKDYFSKTKTDECSIPIFSNGIKEDGLYGYTKEPKVIKPSVTISARGTIGYPVYRSEPFVPIIRLIVLTPYQKIVTANYLMIVVKNLEILNVGSAIPQLTVPMIKNYSVLIPSQDIQEKISDLVSVYETKISQTQSKLKEQLRYLKQLKSSILSKAFKGEL